MKIKALCTLALLVLTASFVSSQTVTRCGGPANALSINWPTFHFDNCRSGNNPYERILSSSTVAGLQVKWKFNNGETAALPILWNNVLYLYTRGDLGGYLNAVDANSGSIIWSQENGYDLVTPAIANGMLYAPYNGGMLALDAATGTTIWYYYGVYGNSPAVSDGLVYAAGYDSTHLQVVALNASTGTPLWTTPVVPINGSLSATTVVNGVVYVSATKYGDQQDNVSLALNAHTGSVIWVTPVGPAGYAAPAVVNGVVYFGSDDNKFWALNASTGAVLWTFTTQGAVRSTPAVANGVVYVTCKDKHVYALDASTGKRLWSSAFSGGISAPPVLANGVLYFGAEDLNIYALDAATGATLWTYFAGGDSGISASPVVANGVLYGPAGGDAGLFAFHLPGH